MSRITRVEVHEFAFEAHNLARDGVAQTITYRKGSAIRVGRYAVAIHTADGGNSSCIDSATEAYLVNRTVPPKGKVCQQQVPFEAASATAGEAAAATSADRVSAIVSAMRRPLR